MKTIVITGSTDGIGLATAKELLSLGHHVVIHGRTKAKINTAVEGLSKSFCSELINGISADLADLRAVKTLVSNLRQQVGQIDVLINNAGVFKADSPITEEGYDIRFLVNTIAPYLLTNELVPMLRSGGRIINLSSAAQAPVNLDALAGSVSFEEDFKAYAQSKLALTGWTHEMAEGYADRDLLLVAVNPGSLLATKMVKDGFGVAGNDVGQGADILCRAALSDEFNNKHGQYFDNDSGQFSPPHPDALDSIKNRQIIQTIESVIERLT